MANNFHDNGGMLVVGIDLHLALVVPPWPTPVPRMPHLNFLHPFTMGGNQKATVLFNGRPTVVHWHQPTKLWPHLNLPPFPIDILIPLDILFGQQTAWLPRGTVQIEGETATCCNIAGPVSVNLDCWDFGNIPSSLVMQPSTVQTSPSLSDYAAGVQSFAIDLAINVLFNVAGAALSGVASRAARGARSAVARAASNQAGDAAADVAGRETAGSVASLLNRNLDLPQETLDLAAREGREAAQREAREAVVRAFADRHGVGQSVDGALRGIDLDRPVRIVDVQSGETLDQYVRTSDWAGPHADGFGRAGNWFDRQGGQSGDALGLNVDNYWRTSRPFEVPPGGPYPGLESTAAPIVDTWTNTGQHVWTPGGGTQTVLGDDAVSQINGHNTVDDWIAGL